MACTDLFWHTFYTGAGITLGVVLMRKGLP
jgi:hypothetical protein